MKDLISIKDRVGEEPSSIEDGFLDAHLFRVDMVDNHYKQIIQFLVTGKSREEFTMSQRRNWLS